MVIVCSKCHGKVIVDCMFKDKSCYELMCLACGQRWFPDKLRDRVGIWIASLDKIATITR